MLAQVCHRELYQIEATEYQEVFHLVLTIENRLLLFTLYIIYSTFIIAGYRINTSLRSLNMVTITETSHENVSAFTAPRNIICM